MTDKEREQMHQAIGWLREALKIDHPGYLTEQAERAERAGYTDTAAGLRRLAGK